MEQVRFGIVGLGSMGLAHARLIMEQVEEARLAAVRPVESLFLKYEALPLPPFYGLPMDNRDKTNEEIIADFDAFLETQMGR